jgi:hypothetical protein
MMTFSDDTVVGYRHGRAIKFSELLEEYKITLQNADTWEQWHQRSLGLCEELVGLRKELAGLGLQTEGLRQSSENLKVKVEDYETVLQKIFSHQVDSLAWSKDLAQEAYYKFNSFNGMEE